MGGFGSGGHNARGLATCESCHSIDLAWLRRRGMLTPGCYATLTWSQVGEQTGGATAPKSLYIDEVMTIYLREHA